MSAAVTAEDLAIADDLSDLSTAALTAFANRSIRVQAQPGTTVMRQGESGFKLFVILEGTADVITDGTRIAEVGAGSVVGEMSVLTGDQRNADVVATSEMTLAAMMVWDFTALCDEFSEIATAIEAIAESRR
jgi:CRP-like cAMP-binding protein